MFCVRKYAVVRMLMSKLLKAVDFAHQLHKQIITAGDIAIDATAGKGFDTEFLARLVGEQGHVYAFDIQMQALQWTGERLSAAGLRDRVTLYHAGHEDMLMYLSGRVRSVMFNLGYLPGANHNIITQPATTVRAVQAALQILQIGGLITIVIYPGHIGGAQEQQALEAYTASLPQREYTVIRYEIINQVNNPPLVVAIERNAEERVFV